MRPIRNPGGLVRRIVDHPAARCAASCLISAALRRLNVRHAGHSSPDAVVRVQDA
ncbi:hypothetical protein [Streptodolium elevatio]|uniref:Uncharacterized protein n=1 Tax=Streptodolium elevatio TaxID=3157996 RepID=A0ABV3DQU9_9ACTN